MPPKWKKGASKMPVEFLRSRTFQPDAAHSMMHIVCYELRRRPLSKMFSANRKAWSHRHTQANFRGLGLHKRWLLQVVREYVPAKGWVDARVSWRPLPDSSASRQTEASMCACRTHTPLLHLHTRLSARPTMFTHARACIGARAEAWEGGAVVKHGSNSAVLV
eukprot:6172701-Pleurochrysis_carterae.AAC.3